MAELFKLPSSSYDELVKIIKAYSGAKEGTVQTLDDVAQSTKIDRTTVSANNGFLVQIGIITEGHKKGTTDSGRLLGRAYNSKIEAEVSRIWYELINDNDFLNRMISALRIRERMEKNEFLNHIVYSSGQNNSSKIKTGAGAIIEIFKIANVLIENDGKLEIIENTIIDDKYENKQVVGLSQNINKAINQKNGDLKNVNLNINIDITCNVENIDELSQKLKIFLKEITEA